MSKIINVEIAKLIPNFIWVYEDHLKLARDMWDQQKFDDGSWIKVLDMGGMDYYIIDGDHRAYISLFEKGHQTGKVTLLRERDYERPSSFEAHRATCQSYIRMNNMALETDVTMKDLEHRIKEGSYLRINENA